MALGDISKLMGDGDTANIPDLDWAVVDIENKDNIPVPMNVQIIPQLEEAWTYTGKDKTASLIHNIAHNDAKIEKISSEDVAGVINTAKKEIMTGLTGKPLAEKLASIYPAKLIKASTEGLKKLSEEQGLLGNVYVDLTPFDSCKEAARVLGNNKIRLAKYVVGEPKRHVCASHCQGFCKELKKKVSTEIQYSEDILEEYANHLRVAGVIGKSASISSKEELRSAILFSNKKTAAKEKPKKKGVPNRSFEEVQKEFKAAIMKKASKSQEQVQVDRFSEVRPVLAFMQNEMLKGHMGGSLKEALQKKYSGDTIKKYAEEIKKLASLQGLLGNVYVDVSLYETSEDAIKAVKTASTSPTYVIQSVKKNEYDNADEKVAKATGCQILPRDGKIDSKIASSYIDDLHFNDRISSDKASVLRNTLEAGNSVLSILREAFMATQDHTPAKREGGVKGFYRHEATKKYAKDDVAKEAAYKAVTAGISIDKIESKLSSIIPTVEAAGMIRDVLANIKEVDANVLSNCTSEKYHLSSDAKLKQASKCSTCILNNCDMCMSQGLRFANTKEEDGIIKLDPHTKKIQLNNNPDEARGDMSMEEDMIANRWGSGNNIMLDSLRKEASETDVDTSYDGTGLDAGLLDI